MFKVYVIHENPLWLPPFAAAFNRIGLPWSELDLTRGTFDLSSAPPAGIFYNRMSASSHTRGHRYSAELTAAVISWLTSYGRTVINGANALDLEINKVRQYSALTAAGLSVPRTVLVCDDASALISAAQTHFGGGAVILKPNRGGKGFGVRLFANVATLKQFISSVPADETPVDGIWLLQEYVRAARPVITRAEFVGGSFVYAVEVDTSSGFELCPADACAVGDAACPVGEAPTIVSAPPSLRFTVLPHNALDPAFINQLEKFVEAVRIDVTGIEFIRDLNGRPLVYDVNTNTNYNRAAEEASGIADTPNSGPGALAAFLQTKLNEIKA